MCNKIVSRYPFNHYTSSSKNADRTIWRFHLRVVSGLRETGVLDFLPHLKMKPTFNPRRDNTYGPGIFPVAEYSTGCIAFLRLLRIVTDWSSLCLALHTIQLNIYIYYIFKDEFMVLRQEYVVVLSICHLPIAYTVMSLMAEWQKTDVE